MKRGNRELCIRKVRGKGYSIIRITFFVLTFRKASVMMYVDTIDEMIAKYVYTKCARLGRRYYDYK